MAWRRLVSFNSFWAKLPRRFKLIIASGLFALLVLIPAASVLLQASPERASGTEDHTEVPQDEDSFTLAPTPAAPWSPTPVAARRPNLSLAPSYSGPTIDSLRAQGITYEPGNLKVEENGLLLSKGLKSRIVATKRRRVVYSDGGLSDEQFHKRPDFGACFPVPEDDFENPGGFVYTSNSEMEEENEGGVGAVTFDKEGNVIHYAMVLKGTTMNCGGGRTPWNTWVSCEEVLGSGEIYQVDPFGRRKSEKTSVGHGKGRFESFTYDDRDRAQPRFFASEDRTRGALRRFTPSNVDWDDPWEMLHCDGTLDFLVIEPQSENATQGTFRWTDDIEEAKQNAETHYPQSEGIDRDEDILFLVTKEDKWLFVLSLDSMTYSRYSTNHGVFDGAPDQVARVLNADHDMLYFTEERGNHSGIHGRNSANQFFTVLEGIDFSRETTGLSFSPDGKRMLFAFQEDGVLFEVTREDGRAFHGKSLNVGYHTRAAALS